MARYACYDRSPVYSMNENAMACSRSRAIGRDYFSDLAFIGLWGNKYVPIARPIDVFLWRTRTRPPGVPQAASIDPNFVGEGDGTSNDGYMGRSVLRSHSILKMIETRWSMNPLSARDANAKDLAGLLDSQEPRSAPQYPVQPIIAGAACPFNQQSPQMRGSKPSVTRKPATRSRRAGSPRVS